MDNFGGLLFSLPHTLEYSLNFFISFIYCVHTFPQTVFGNHRNMYSVFSFLDENMLIKKFCIFTKLQKVSCHISNCEIKVGEKIICNTCYFFEGRENFFEF